MRTASAPMRSLALSALALLAVGCTEPADTSATAPPPATGAASASTAPTPSPDIPPAGDSLDAATDE